MPNDRCPWYLSARAVTEFAKILHLDPEIDANFDRSEDLLIEVARSAKFERNQDNGLQLWLSSVPIPERNSVKERARLARAAWSSDPRLQLLVSTKQQAEGNLPQLVRVLQRGQR